MKTKLLFAVPECWYRGIFRNDSLARIGELCQVVDAPVPVTADAAFILSHVGDVEALVSSWDTAPVDEQILAAAPELKLVLHAAGSVKPIMTDAAWAKGIRVTSAAPAIAQGVAESCLGFMLTAPKRFYWLAERVRRDHWRETFDIFGPAFEIYHQDVGIIGASLVGRQLVELLKPFTCNVLLYDPHWSAEAVRELGATKVDTLEELFKQCRVVSLNAPLTDETAGMIRGRHFALLQHGSVFINTARGKIINQAEMVDELRKGRFVACLDVTDPEPPLAGEELRRLPNVLLTPHITGAFQENQARLGEFVAWELAAYRVGKPLRGEVTRQHLATIA